MKSVRPLPVTPILAALAVLAGCAGCGSDDVSATGAGSASTVHDDDGRTLVAALGDSITAGTPLWAADAATREQIGPALDERSQYEFWAAKADPSLEFRNCGINGERTDQIALRLEECVGADGGAEGGGAAGVGDAGAADALIVQGGINDIAQGRPVEDAAADLRSMVERGKELGLAVAIVELLPWNNGHPGADPEIEELNRLINGIGEDEGIPVMPWHEALEDPREPGTMRADLTIEGDHPSVAGYRILGTKAFVPPEDAD